MIEMQPSTLQLPRPSKAYGESARNVVVPDNGYAEHLRGLRSEEHGFTGTRSDIKVMAFDLTGLGLSFVDGLGYEQESITPSEVQTAT